MLEIRDSVAVITGGARGIGKALAEYWVVNGGKVVLADMAEEALEEATVSLEGLGGRAVGVVCDVTMESDCAHLADAAMETFGKINLVAPFAGITRDCLVLSTDRETGKVSSRMSLDQFQSVLDINLTGVFLTIRECTERMINCGCKGLICLVSSTGSLGTAGQLNYSSSKAAVAVMPKVFTAEFFRRGLADKIRCVAIAPGYVGTAMVQNMGQKVLDKILDQVPIGRLIDPYEVASLVGHSTETKPSPGRFFSSTAACDSVPKDSNF